MKTKRKASRRRLLTGEGNRQIEECTDTGGDMVEGGSSCLLCGGGDDDNWEEMLICCGLECSIALHERCLPFGPRFDELGRFHCPYCWFKRENDRFKGLRKKVMLAQKALSDFIGEKSVSDYAAMRNDGMNLDKEVRNEVLYVQDSEDDKDGGNAKVSLGDRVEDVRNEVSCVQGDSGNEKGGGNAKVNQGDRVEEVRNEVQCVRGDSENDKDGGNAKVSQGEEMVEDHMYAADGAGVVGDQVRHNEVEEPAGLEAPLESMIKENTDVGNQAETCEDEVLEKDDGHIDDSRNEGIQVSNERVNHLHSSCVEEESISLDSSTEDQGRSGKLEEQETVMMSTRGDVAMKVADTSALENDCVARHTRKRGKNTRQSFSKPISLDVEEESISPDSSTEDQGKSGKLEEQETVLMSTRGDVAMKVADTSDLENDSVARRTRNRGKNTTHSPRVPSKKLSPQVQTSTFKEKEGIQNKSAQQSTQLKESPKKIANLKFPHERRRKMYWTFEEEQMLKKGVKKFSVTCNKNLPWIKILEFGHEVFHSTRTPMDLKDKWRNMLRKEKAESRLQQ